MTPKEALEILEEVKQLDDTLYAYSPAYMDALEVAISTLKEGQQYHKIGTVEECREAVEKQKPKKPHRNYKKFSGLWCKCGWYLGQKQCLDIKYCPNCGQAIDENLEGMEDE